MTDEKKNIPEAVKLKSRKYSIALWNAKWNKQELLERYENMTPRAFERGYRQRPISDDELVFSAAAIEKARDESWVMPDSGADPKWQDGPRDAGVDLAIADTSSDGSYFCVVGVKTLPDWHRWVMHVHMERGLTFLQQIDYIKELHLRYGYASVKVENNNYQRAMVQTLGSTTLVPVTGYRTGVMQKTDFQVGVPSLAAEFERGTIHIPYGNAASIRMADMLISQLVEYTHDNRGQHDDAVMALFFAREARTQQARARPRVMMLRV